MYKKQLYGYVIEMEYSSSYIDGNGDIKQNSLWNIHYSSKIYTNKQSAITALEQIKRHTNKELRLKSLYEFVQKS